MLRLMVSKGYESTRAEVLGRIVWEEDYGKIEKTVEKI